LGGRGVLLHHEYPADADRDDQASSGGEPRQFALGRGGVVDVEVAGSEAAALERRAVVGREGAATRAGEWIVRRCRRRRGRERVVRGYVLLTRCGRSPRVVVLVVILEGRSRW